MKWKTRTRGSARQIGQKFPVREKKKLPKLIQTTFPSGRKGLEPFYRKAQSYREALAKRMARKPVLMRYYVSPEGYGSDQFGMIQFYYDGAFLSNAVRLVTHDKWVGSWDKSKPWIYIDDDVPPKYWKSLAIHESVEKYLKEKYGLDENAEGHEASEEVERRRFCKESKCPADWDEYSKIVERVHRAEMKYAERNS